MGLPAKTAVEMIGNLDQFSSRDTATERERKALSEESPLVIESRITVKVKSLQQPCVFMKGNGLLPSNAVYLGSRKTCDEERKPVHEHTFKL